MENQPECSNDQKLKKVIDAIEAVDDKEVPLEIKDCFWKDRNDEKSRKKLCCNVCDKRLSSCSSLCRHRKSCRGYRFVRIESEADLRRLDAQYVDRLKSKAINKKPTDLPKRYLCDRCDKNFANHRSLWGHKKRICQRHIEPTILKWNGKSWETKTANMHYQLNLGRDLSDLLERGAIKEEALNSTQRKYIQMYKSLFQADDS